MSIYSGFISSFNNSLPPTGIDLMSNISQMSVSTWYGNTVAPTNYTSGYMYIGNLLVQFSISPDTLGALSLPNTNTNNPITINFPIHFSNPPYCVLANSKSVSSNINYGATVISSPLQSFVVQTWNGTGYIQYIAIGPR